MSNNHAPRWSNRIVGTGELDPEQILANEANWRIHPAAQRAALRGLLAGAGLDDLADTTRILNGLEVARRFGIKLPTVTLTKKRQANETWRRYVT